MDGPHIFLTSVGKSKIEIENRGIRKCFLCDKLTKQRFLKLREYSHVPISLFRDYNILIKMERNFYS